MMFHAPKLQLGSKGVLYEVALTHYYSTPPRISSTAGFRWWRSTVGEIGSLIMDKIRKPLLSKQEILARLADHAALLQTFHVRRIGLFGSYARQEQTKQSDIDLLVEFESASFDNFMNLAFAMERLFHKKIDLIMPESLSPYLKPLVEQEVAWLEV
jgi:predicted nucleotidyltransferase